MRLILSLALIFVFGLFAATSARQIQLTYNAEEEGRALEKFRPTKPPFQLNEGNPFDQHGNLRHTAKRNRTRTADSLFMQVEAVQDESYNLICVMLLLMTALFMIMNDCNDVE